MCGYVFIRKSRGMIKIIGIEGATKRIIARLEAVKPTQEYWETLGNSIVSETRRRVHNDGRDVRNRKIGDYSTNPMYVNPAISPKSFTPEGKTGKTSFADGTAHKTKYFGAGYKGFRGFIGRRTNTVDLQLTGSLFKGYTFQVVNPKKMVIGFISGQAKKAEGNEKRFNTLIYGYGVREKKVFEQVTKAFLDGKN